MLRRETCALDLIDHFGGSVTPEPSKRVSHQVDRSLTVRCARVAAPGRPLITLILRLHRRHGGRRWPISRMCHHTGKGALLIGDQEAPAQVNRRLARWSYVHLRKRNLRTPGDVLKRNSSGYCAPDPLTVCPKSTPVSVVVDPTGCARVFSDLQTCLWAAKRSGSAMLHAQPSAYTSGVDFVFLRRRMRGPAYSARTPTC